MVRVLYNTVIIYRRRYHTQNPRKKKAYKAVDREKDEALE